MRKLYYFHISAITIFLLSMISISLVEADPFTEAHLIWGANDTNYNYNTNYTFNVTVVGGTPDYIINYYIDNKNVWNGSLQNEGDKYIFWKRYFPEGWHTVYAEVTDQYGFCCSPDGVYCDNTLYTELYAFYVNSIGSIADTELYYGWGSSNLTYAYRNTNISFVTGEISGGTPPYNVTLAYWNTNGYVPLAFCNGTAEGAHCSGTFFGKQFPQEIEQSGSKYSLLLIIKDSAGGSNTLGSYYVGQPASNALWPITIYDETKTQTAPTLDGSFRSNEVDYYEETNSEFTLNYTFNRGVPPYNLTIGYQNASSLKTIPICSFYNTDKTFIQLKLRPTYGVYRWTAYTYDSYNCFSNPATCGSLYAYAMNNLTTWLGNNSDSIKGYAYNPTLNYVEGCVEQGGVLGFPYGLNGGLDPANIQTFDSNPFLQFDILLDVGESGMYFGSDGQVYDDEGNLVDWIEIDEQNVETLNGVMVFVSSKEFIWTSIMLIVGVTAEWKAKAKGKAFALTTLILSIVYTVAGIYPIWVPIIYVIVGGLVAFKLFKGD